MDVLQKNCLVIGMARSGIASAALLSRHGANVVINDIKSASQLGESLNELKDIPNIAWKLGEDPIPLLERANILVISPGVPIYSPVVKRAQELGVLVMGELELSYRLSQGRVFAITGTNGKTTTTTLVGDIFKNAGKLTYVVGNIGIPFAGIADKTRPEDITVVEVSSFQLESISSFRPTVSAVLNITEDHLNRHGTMDEYIRYKKRIFENQRSDEIVVLNYDDPVVRAMSEECIARPVFFSRKAVVDGAYVLDGSIVFGKDNPKQVCRVEEVRIPGPHNLENALAAAAMTISAGVPIPVVRHTLRTFAGVEHRIEFVREVDGVRYINDSKGTNVDSVLKAIETMQRPTIIIVGGYDKHTDFTPMCQSMKDSSNIEGAVVIGQTQKQIVETLDKVGFKNYRLAGDFKEAVESARAMSSEGGNVLLSPGCASFDMFSDFEQRGRVFKEIVNSLK